MGMVTRLVRGCNSHAQDAKRDSDFIDVHQSESYNDSQLVSNTFWMSVSSGFCIP